MKNKTIIIFDGHGCTNQEKTLLKYTHYFLCEAGKTVGSDVFNKINYNLKIQYTDFHPETKCQLVYVRVENKQPIQLSILEKLIFPIFIDSENPILESCGMGIEEKTESEAIGLWGACREFI